MLGPDGAGQRRAAADELLELAHGVDDLEMRFSAHHFRVADCLERADLAGVETELEACGHFAGLLRQPLYRWQYGLLRAMRALLAGRAEESERLTLEAYEHGRVVDEQAAANLLAAQLFNHRWMVGRLGELAGAIDDFADQRPWIPTWRCAAAFLRSEIGELDAARERLDEVGRHGFVDLPRDGNWSAGIAVAAYVASALGAREHAAALYELAVPTADRIVIVAAGDALIGPLALPVAALATTLERWEEGLAHLKVADRLNARLDARPMIATAHRERARLLLARGRLEDLAAARHACNQALVLARDLGMARLIEQTQELLDTLPVGRMRAPASGGAATAVGARAQARRRRAVLERTGDVWRVGREPATTLVRHSRGMEHLARLLASPGIAFAAVELAGGGAPGQADAATAERARLNVTRALRAAVAKITAYDDALGHELGSSVITGALMRYEPAGPAPTQWRVRAIDDPPRDLPDAHAQRA
jgi:tetratricopeptide (TPR) repeat protein